MAAANATGLATPHPKSEATQPSLRQHHKPMDEGSCWLELGLSLPLAWSLGAGLPVVAGLSLGLARGDSLWRCAGDVLGMGLAVVMGLSLASLSSRGPLFLFNVAL